MNQNLLLFTLLVVMQCLTAQTYYSHPTKESKVLSVNEENPQEKLLFEKWLAEKTDERLASEKNAKVNNLKTLPVIFHLVYYAGDTIGQGANISHSYIQSQIDVLNQAFRHQNADTANIPSVFKPFAADMEVEFCLATFDSMGNTLAEQGVDRINASTKGWINASLYTQTYITNTIKKNSIWNPNHYLNIWVLASLPNLQLAYSTFPTGSGLPGLNFGSVLTYDDGIVIYANMVGANNPNSGNYNEGGILVESMGIFLGLRHIHGDSPCGNDYCSDTPTQNDFNYVCPSFPHITCNNGPNGDMFNNFMDFTDDVCENMFTLDQKTRVQTVLSLSPRRASLVNSPACTGISPITFMQNKGNKSKVSPNPFTDVLNVNIDLEKNTPLYLELVDILGKSIKQSAFLGSIGENHFSIPTKDIATGIYFLKIHYENQIVEAQKVIK